MKYLPSLAALAISAALIWPTDGPAPAALASAESSRLRGGDVSCSNLDVITYANSSCDERTYGNANQWRCVGDTADSDQGCDYSTNNTGYVCGTTAATCTGTVQYWDPLSQSWQNATAGSCASTFNYAWVNCGSCSPIPANPGGPVQPTD